MMIGKRSRGKISKPAQRVVDRSMPRLRRAGHRVGFTIVELPCSSSVIPRLAARSSPRSAPPYPAPFDQEPSSLPCC